MGLPVKKMFGYEYFPLLISKKKLILGKRKLWSYIPVLTIFSKCFLILLMISLNVNIQSWTGSCRPAIVSVQVSCSRLLTYLKGCRRKEIMSRNCLRNTTGFLRTIYRGINTKVSCKTWPFFSCYWQKAKCKIIIVEHA